MNLQKKLKKMKLSEDSIEIVWEGEATQSELEKRFCKLINGTPKEEDKGWEEYKTTFYVYQNSKGYYLYGYNKPDISYYGIDTSDYKLIDICEVYPTHPMPLKYSKWNPESRTGLTDEQYSRFESKL